MPENYLRHAYSKLSHTIERLEYCLTIEQDIRVAAEIHLTLEEIRSAMADLTRDAFKNI